jgi:hypothetical protein
MAKIGIVLSVTRISIRESCFERPSVQRILVGRYASFYAVRLVKESQTAFLSNTFSVPLFAVKQTFVCNVSCRVRALCEVGDGSIHLAL